MTDKSQAAVLPPPEKPKRCIWYEPPLELLCLGGGCLPRSMPCSEPYNTDCPDYADNDRWSEYKRIYNLQEVEHGA